MNSLIRAVDELLQCVADPGYKVDVFTFQPLREARRAMLPGDTSYGEPEDCHDPTCGGFICVPLSKGVLGCNAPDCNELTDPRIYCNGRTGGYDDCPGCPVCSPCRCATRKICLSPYCETL